MVIMDIYSKKLKRANGDVPDVYTYDEIPQGIKETVLYILKSSLKKIYYSEMDRTLYKEKKNLFFDNLYDQMKIAGLQLDPSEKNQDKKTSLENFFLNKASTEDILDIVQLSFGEFSKIEPTQYGKAKSAEDITKIVQNGIETLNSRLQEEAIGYQLESGQIIRIDNKIIHKEAIKPALALLHDPVFAGANEEFLEAHKHYRSKSYKECIASCGKALESTLKIIAEQRGWEKSSKETAAPLLEKCFSNKLIPSYLQEQYKNLLSLLKGSATIRNNAGGHGQGSKKIEVPKYLAQYALNLTASAIVFLVNAHNNAVPEETPSL
ncbi:MAG: hypothetical protein ABF697_08690 [Zymomonas mobilis]|uniref:STM4504/CBY_0614 family protein n=1 Tax=Zymomonas mobilis TaxID=542 RepID=UPI0039EAFD2C